VTNSKLSPPPQLYKAVEVNSRSIVQTRKHVIALNILHFTLASCGLPDPSFTSINVHNGFPVRSAQSVCVV